MKSRSRALVLGQFICAASWLPPPTSGALQAQQANATAPASATAPATTATAPARPAPPAKPVAAPDAGRSGTPASLQLMYRTVALPSGRVGVAYGPKHIVEGGVPPYSFTLSGKFPHGLELGTDGMLAGVPLAADTYDFELEVHDASTPPVITQQWYSLRVEKEKPAAAPGKLAASAEEEAASDLDAGGPVTYMLTRETLQKATAPHGTAGAANTVEAGSPPADSAATAGEGSTTEAGAAAGPPPADLSQLEALTAPLIGVEYPTLSLFRTALEAARCGYYQKQPLPATAVKHPIDLKCPPGAAARQRYEELLPDKLRDSIVGSAATAHALDGPPQPLNLSGNGCSCAPRSGPKEVYGFYPFWDATSARQPLDFGVFTRIAFMGVVLNPAGDYSTPADWLGKSGNFARMAHRFDTRLDLVVYRHDWTWLLTLPDDQIGSIARRAADTAVGMIDTPLEEPYAPRPFWPLSRRGPVHVYDGITVFFEDPHFNAAGTLKFQSFLSTYLQHVISSMQRQGRRYNLNIVVGDELVDDDGPFGYQKLIDYIELAEPPITRKGAAVKSDDWPHYAGTTPITVDLLVLMGEPTTAHKKAFRAAADQIKAPYDGHRRVAFLQSVVPVIFHSTGAQPAAPLDLAHAQINKDIAYYQWTFGGVGFWPVPQATVGDGAAVLSLLRADTGDKDGTGHSAKLAAASEALCRVVCPNRDLMRLVFELLVMLAAGLGIARMVICREHRAEWVQIAFAITGVLALICGGMLLSCDPALNALKHSNWLLFGLIVALVLFGTYKSLKPRIPPP